MKKLITLSIISLFLFLSCGGTDTILVTELGKKIGSDGGKYKGIDGVVVNIPKNALDQTITVTIYSLDTPPFTNVSYTITNIYTISPFPLKFKTPVTISIPYSEDKIPQLLDERDLRPYYAIDREHIQPIDKKDYELDVENNLIRIRTSFLGNFHIGIPKKLVEDANSQRQGVAEMVYIPEGDFEYGAPKGTPTGVLEGQSGIKKSEGLNTVHLSGYYIDVYEVTNAQYQLCVSAGVCTEPYHNSSTNYPEYYNNPAYMNFPVIWVSWDQANTFCQWAGKLLPTEAQWEKAAKGAKQRKYPWGDKDSQENTENALANFGGLFEDVMDTTSFSSSVSPYGVYNMAGNVAEWTRNWYDLDTYYKKISTKQVDPHGPDFSTDKKKVIKGGSWVSLQDEITTYARDKAFTHYRYYNIGFRCVKEKSEE